VIYFMQPLAGGPVKIGFSDDVDARRRQLERHYGQPLAVLATLDGGPDEERELHGRFSHLRFGRTEQFQPGTDLMEFIGRPVFASMAPVEPMQSAAADPQRQDVSIKFDRILAAKARQIALARGAPMAEYLSELSRAAIDRDYAKLLRELEGGTTQGDD
jgi:hypothetical protein